jgi:secreted Zn-dependent insulinase-like peptidase
MTKITGLIQSLFIATALVSTAMADTVSNEIVPDKGPNDEASYRYLELSNGMGALLVSDPRADKAAAALDVHVGAGADPDSRAGLAHFTEHMLFLGTETYPDPGEYHQFINSHGGSHNAYTSGLDTNYFFNIEPEFLEPALDRFSEQFRAPTFAEELIDRERNAVHSEYSAHLRSDNRRFWSALRRTFPEAHPLSRFTVGNQETLSNDNNELRDETVQFYEKHYSANLMELVVLGPQSLDELQEMVVGRFSPVENRGHNAPRYTTPFLEADKQPRLLRVKALRDKRNLQLTFPIPSTEADYRNKPLEFLSHLIGHEGPGSLHAVLKEAGLIDTLSAGQSLDTGDQAMMNISMSVTPQGRERWQDIVSLSFRYLSMIAEKGIKQAYFEEQQQLNDLNLRFRERNKPIHEVSTLASRLHRVDPADVVVAPWLYETFEPAVYREILEHLSADRVLVSLLAPFEDTEGWDRTQYYDTPYRITDIDPNAINAGGAVAELEAKLAVPGENPFVPEDLSLVSGKNMEAPSRLGDGPLTLWYAQDTQFGAPRANVYLNLRSPAANGSPRNVVLTRLLTELVKDELNAFAYPARLADLDYSIYNHLRGITVKVSGYNDKLPHLLNEILTRLRHPTLASDAFETRLRDLKDELGNAAQRRPHKIASSRLQENLMADVHSHQARLEAARNLELEDLENHVETFYESLDPVMMVHGNITRAAALNLRTRTSSLIMADAEETEVPRSDLKRLASGSQTVETAVQHSDQGYLRYIQGADKEYETKAAYRVMAQVLSSPFYEAVRTNQQMGYIVQAMAYPILDVPALAFIVQSPDNSHEDIDTAVQSFLKSQKERLATMSSDRFQRQKEAVISRIAEDPTQLSEVADRYWQEIDRMNLDFDTREKLISAIKELDQERFQEIYRQQVLDSPKQLLINANSKVPQSAQNLQHLNFDGEFPSP